jgi:hypothetical protein
LFGEREFHGIHDRKSKSAKDILDFGAVAQNTIEPFPARQVDTSPPRSTDQQELILQQIGASTLKSVGSAPETER